MIKNINLSFELKIETGRIKDNFVLYLIPTIAIMKFPYEMRLYFNFIYLECFIHFDWFNHSKNTKIIKRKIK